MTTKKISIKKFLLRSAGVLLVLVLILATHIYMVTGPKAPDMNTIVMARIDIHQPITATEAEKITTWMYQQKGVAHVLCNKDMDNIVFTYRAVMADGNSIAEKLRTDLGLGNAVRYVPTEKELKGGCPVAATSVSYRMYSYIRHIF